MTLDVTLRDATHDDLAVFIEHERDPDARHMAAFGPSDPGDRHAALARWQRIVEEDGAMLKTVVVDGEVAGNMVHFSQFDKPSVAYWIGKPHWGRGIATRALAEFLRLVTTRPLYARVAQDNVASRRVLEHCGFAVIGEDSGFSNIRDADVPEFLLELR